VTAYTGWTIAQRFQFRLRNSSSDEARYEQFIERGKGFGRRVEDALRNADRDLGRSVFFGYDTGSLEPLTFLSETGCFTIVDQIDPGPVEKEIVLDEIERWPGWAKTAPVLHKPYQERRQVEWEQADAVIVNSEWSKRALMQQDVCQDKLHVVPLAYEPSPDESNGDEGPSQDGALRVLWLGQVNLRKGIQYLIEAAHTLTEAAVVFEVVGPLQITEEAVAYAPSNVTFHGEVPRDRTTEFYQQADVFVLPTLSDGFALTQLEAMAHGVPVVTTPNCGRVVTDGQDGWMIPPRDPDALAETLAFCAQNRSQVRDRGARARSTSKQYSLGNVADALLSIPA
jgi:glycosyltransferase involved in cell wall biosynthesis